MAKPVPVMFATAFGGPLCAAAEYAAARLAHPSSTACEPGVAVPDLGHHGEGDANAPDGIPNGVR